MFQGRVLIYSNRWEMSSFEFWRLTPKTKKLSACCKILKSEPCFPHEVFPSSSFLLLPVFDFCLFCFFLFMNMNDPCLKLSACVMTPDINWPLKKITRYIFICAFHLSHSHVTEYRGSRRIQAINHLPKTFTVTLSVFLSVSLSGLHLKRWSNLKRLLLYTRCRSRQVGLHPCCRSESLCDLTRGTDGHRDTCWRI